MKVNTLSHINFTHLVTEIKQNVISIIKDQKQSKKNGIIEK